MHKFNIIIAQNAMGKSTLARGPNLWVGRPIGPKPNTINVIESQYGYLHDCRNWVACGHIDLKAFWEHMFILIARHDIVFLNNSVERLNSLPQGINCAIVTYNDPRDGVERWKERDPSYFKSLTDDEALFLVMSTKSAYLKAARRLPKGQCQLFTLDRGKFLSDLALELF